MSRRVIGSFALFAALSFAGSGSAVAQDVIVGVKGGINMADLSIEDDSGEAETDSRTGFVGGLFAQIGLSDVFAVRGEGLYSEKGTTAQESGTEFDAKLAYLEVPLLLVARIPTGGSVRPYALAGPVVSFETTCEIELSDTTGSVTDDCETFDEEDPVLTKGTDFGVAFGGGVELGSERLAFLLDGRYTLGLRDLNDIEAAPESFKNRAWSFTAGVGLKVG